MNKILLLLFFFLLSYNYSFSEELVLSDKIQAARDAAKLQSSSTTKDIKPVSVDSEKSACEKEEIKQMAYNSSTSK